MSIQGARRTPMDGGAGDEGFGEQQGDPGAERLELQRWVREQWPWVWLPGTTCQGAWCSQPVQGLTRNWVQWVLVCAGQCPFIPRAITVTVSFTEWNRSEGKDFASSVQVVSTKNTLNMKSCLRPDTG